MHQQKQTTSYWLNKSNTYRFFEIDDAEDESQHCFDPDRNQENERDDNYSEISGPRSTMSFPPSVGPDQDAIVPTPQSMYAPFTPFTTDCCTPPNTPECRDITLPCSNDELQDLSEWSAHRSLKFYQNNAELEDNNSSKNTLPTNSLHQLEYNHNSNLSGIDVQNDDFSDEESEMNNIQDFNEQECCSSIHRYGQDLMDLMSDINDTFAMTPLKADGGPPEYSSERRMSWEQFLEKVFDIHKDRQINQAVHGTKSCDSDESRTSEVPTCVTSAVARNKIWETKMDKETSLGKRRRDEAFYTNSDSVKTGSQYSVKKRLKTPDEGSVYIVNNGLNVQFTSTVPEGSNISEGPDRVPDVDNISKISNNSVNCLLNDFSLGSTIDDSRVRHQTTPEPRGFSHTDLMHSLGISLQAASAGIDTLVDVNGNVMRINLQETDSNIHRFCEESAHTVKKETIITGSNIHLTQTVNNIKLFAVKVDDEAFVSTAFSSIIDPSNLTLTNNTTVTHQFGNMSSVCDIPSTDTTVTPQFRNMRSVCDIPSTDTTVTQQFGNMRSVYDIPSTATTATQQFGNISSVCDIPSTDTAVTQQFGNMRSVCDIPSKATTVTQQFGNMSSVCDIPSTDMPQLGRTISFSDLILNDTTTASQLRHLPPGDDLSSTHLHIYLTENHDNITEQHYAQLHEQSQLDTPVTWNPVQDFNQSQVGRVSSDVSLARSSQEMALPLKATSTRPQDVENISTLQKLKIHPLLFGNAICRESCQNTVDYQDEFNTCAPIEDSTINNAFVPNKTDNDTLYDANLCGRDNMCGLDTDNAGTFKSRDDTPNLSNDTFNSTIYLDSDGYVSENLIAYFTGSYKTEPIPGSPAPQAPHQNVFNFSSYSNSHNNGVITIDDDEDDDYNVSMTTQIKTDCDVSSTSANQDIYNWSHVHEGSNDNPQSYSLGLPETNAMPVHSNEAVYVIDQFKAGQEDIALRAYSPVSQTSHQIPVGHKVNLPVSQTAHQIPVAHKVRHPVSQTANQISVAHKVNLPVSQTSYQIPVKVSNQGGVPLPIRQKKHIDNSYRTLDSCNISDSQTVSKTYIPELPHDADPELITAHKRYMETGQLTPVVKSVLKSAINAKRRKEGKGTIDVTFEPSPRSEMTKEEKEKEEHRKELNRIAAATHRQKKKEIRNSTDQVYEDLVKMNCHLKDTIVDLENEKSVLYRSLVSQGIATPDYLKSRLSVCFRDLV